MIFNFHTHTQFCDGKSTAEEMVLSALNKGFSVLGFSGHGYTLFDHTYCMKDTEAYKQEILRLRKKYEKDIEIYLGYEEDAHHPHSRDGFDYVLGSSHYAHKGDVYAPIDSTPETMKRVLALYGGDTRAMAEDYYSHFVGYIKEKKPDIIGHFDILTKFEEKSPFGFFSDPEYHKIAEKYLREALRADCIFEVNTGAISRGWRTLPYPHENLLRVIKREGGRITLTSDCHHADNLDCFFSESREILRDVGFEHVYCLYRGEWIKDKI